MKDVKSFGADHEQGLVSDVKMPNLFTDFEVFKVTHEEYPDSYIYYSGMPFISP